ncbi:cytochrome c-type biogenesis protein CcmH [uncultured Paludibaculum sp.]|uniref:cytochrome c-type biogenesis protein n=1 Tax=uncultured Paludibaculum sp. TaxID=1765020 RepID=UPI002AAAD9F3|nr:cytochrome c-type biogenesis protein CcmH [uncultured Paludibaculum sp.]
MSLRFNVLAAGVLLAIAAGSSLRAESPDAAIRRLQEKFIAPCCWSESVAVHRSEAAAEMRAEIARLYRSGASEQEITAGFVSQYGERILMEPSGTKFTWLIVIPVTVSLVAVAGLILYLRRRPKPAEQMESQALAAVSDDDLDW